MAESECKYEYEVYSIEKPYQLEDLIAYRGANEDISMAQDILQKWRGGNRKNNWRTSAKGENTHMYVVRETQTFADHKAPAKRCYLSDGLGSDIKPRIILGLQYQHAIDYCKRELMICIATSWK